jgi:hypothetical protein
MNSHEPIGYLASVLVLTTLCMRRMVVLRAVAIASNLAFISYGALADIDPVLLLHALLLPTNIYRLMQAIHDERSSRTVKTSVQCAAPVSGERVSGQPARSDFPSSARSPEGEPHAL